MKIIISDAFVKIKASYEEIKECLNKYFLHHILQLEKDYKTDLNWTEILLDDEELQKLKEFKFNDIVESLKVGRTVLIDFASHSMKQERNIYIKPSIEKRRGERSVCHLAEHLADRFVYQNLSIKELDAICEFWCDLISKIPVEEERVAKELKNKFIQTNVYKQIAIREKF